MRKQQFAQDTPQNSNQVLVGSRWTETSAGLSRWTIWRMEAESKFPKSIKVGSKRLYVKAEVLAWIAARIAERG